MSGSAAKRKQLKLKAVAPKQKLFRANEPLLSVFMWGINHTVNELNRVNMHVMLMPDDFKSYSKIRVDNHMFNKDSMPSHFKVKEYCPLVFKNLRDRFGIDDSQYMASLSKQIMSVDSPGKSGARLFLSRDKRFFIKTLVSEEVEMMHHVLKQYHQYIVECHAQTLLPQYLGMYRLTVNDVETYMVVMRNVFSPRLTIHKKYDLKGSTVDRQASEKERMKELPTFKDNDFVNDGAVINVGSEEKEKVMQILQKDVEFLSGLHLMDYSLIVGIHDCSVEDKQHRNNFPPITPMPVFSGELDPELERFGVRSLEGSSKQEIYFMALIDVLTKYGMKKRTAQAAKVVKHGAGAEISTVRPDQYARRFLDFISKCIE
ncbi:hypothetical protein BaRGS_00028862 [Batillaria attramentaria]|uniref:1-phosphatidylinositol-5-phosphate 4-kinase n=1 Tax=Batillaria attramentaria TaxID=370345 RepID=A0ABD0JXT0_9CAEN